MRKPFDLEKALAGVPVVNGIDHRVYVTKAAIPLGERTLFSQNEQGTILAWHDPDGKALTLGYSLYMAPKIVTRWLNVYPITQMYSTQEDADDGAGQKRLGPAIKITYEE